MATDSGGGQGGPAPLTQDEWDSLASLGIDPASEGYVLANDYGPPSSSGRGYANEPPIGPNGTFPTASGYGYPGEPPIGPEGGFGPGAGPTGYPAPATKRGADGLLYYTDVNNNPTGLVPGQVSAHAPAAGGRSPGNSYGTGVAGPSWYEQQKIGLDKRAQDLAEAQHAAANALAQKQQEAQKRASEAQAIEKFNSDYRTYQEKSPYGAQYGPTYFSPAGSVFAQRAPESSVLKDAFASSGQADPWASTGNVPAGYTGVSYMNPQHPGLVDFGHPTVQQDYAQPQTPGTVNQSPSVDDAQFQRWHDLAHQIPQPLSAAQQPTQPVQVGGPNAPVAQLPTFRVGGTVPGESGSPQLIVAHGGEQVTPNQSPDGMSGGGDWQSAFNSWHDAVHQSPGTPSPWSTGLSMSGNSSGLGNTPNAYGQSVSQNTQHGAGQDIVASPLGYNPDTQQYLNNHVQYGPELTGLSGYGATITPNGTPVVMSQWQRQQLDPTSQANYADYAHAIAGWNGADLQQAGQKITGNLGDLSRPTHWAPIGIQPSPSGG